MPEDAFTRENVVAVSFSEHADAYEALSRLKDLDAKGEVGVKGCRRGRPRRRREGRDEG